GTVARRVSEGAPTKDSWFRASAQCPRRSLAPFRRSHSPTCRSWKDSDPQDHPRHAARALQSNEVPLQPVRESGNRSYGKSARRRGPFCSPLSARSSSQASQNRPTTGRTIWFHKKNLASAIKRSILLSCKRSRKRNGGFHEICQVSASQST